MAAIFVYILLLKYRTHEIMQMKITVRICSFPRSLDHFALMEVGLKNVDGYIGEQRV